MTTNPPSPVALVRGVITVAQEDRIRVVDAAGRGYLFTLGKGAGRSVPELWRLARDRRPVIIRYRGRPDQDAVALDVREDARDGAGGGR
jgi:hypothetical protein